MKRTLWVTIHVSRRVLTMKTACGQRAPHRVAAAAELEATATLYPPPTRRHAPWSLLVFIRAGRSGTELAQS